jgi:hypothetical protein
MSTRMDIEELQTTKTEKFLAGVLAVFCLMTGVWAYQKIDDVVADKIQLNAPSNQADAAAIARAGNARQRLFQAEGRVSAARRQLEFRREEYRTALDAGRRAPRLERLYRTTQARLRAAQRTASAARAEVAATQGAAQAASRRQAAEFENRQDRRERWTFFLRLVLAAVSIVVAYWLLWLLHRRRSRYLPLALGTVAATTLLAFVLAGDYVTDYIEPLDLGVLALALFGATVTVLVFWALQRYVRRRIPARRVRRGECPFCGFGVRGNKRCEGCGRDVIAPCARCNEPRRVGARFCGACGAL